MAVNRERQRLVREGIDRARRMLEDPAHVADDGLRCENAAEEIALCVASARDAGVDETLYVEIMAKVVGYRREELLEARKTLRALGYVAVAMLLARLARTAPQRLTWHERMWMKAQRRAELKA